MIKTVTFLLYTLSNVSMGLGILGTIAFFFLLLDKTDDSWIVWELLGATSGVVLSLILLPIWWNLDKEKKFHD